jgi:hypothetical protein
MRVHPKKRSIIFLVIVLLIVALLGANVYYSTHKQDLQHAPYINIKEDLNKKNSGQDMILYPWNPTSAIKILPLNYSVPSTPGNTISLKVCPGEFESASFIITARKDISGIRIEPGDLHDTRGSSIPGDAIDIRLVKAWYQAADGQIGGYDKPGSFLTPELLVRDDAMVNVDYVNRTNFMRVEIHDSQYYIDISTPNATFPDDAEIQDAVSLQPFSMKMHENKQIWVTVHVPDATPAGEYVGTIAMTAPSASPVLMDFRVTVLPFTLEPAPMRYILYYSGRVADTWRRTPIGDDWKTPDQYNLELRDMRDHGVLYPVFSQDDAEPSMLNTALSLRSQSGLPKDRIYLNWNAYIGNATDIAGLTAVADRVKKWRTYTSVYGFYDVYFHGMDEVSGDLVLSQRDAWRAVHDNGGKIVTTSFDTTDPIDLTGNILDAANLGTKINTTAASVMHGYGHEIYLYNQPQVGIEDPEIYRRNYGFSLWNGGYDGAMDFAYQGQYGASIWNDFDSDGIRDHVFAYPASDGVIDTLQWEGWREGVDDTRYVATLIKMEGNDTSTRALVAGSLSRGEEMPAIRDTIISRILAHTSQNTNTLETGAKKLPGGGI